MKNVKAKADKIDTIIGREAYFEGTLSSRESLRIDGKVKGKVHCDGSLVVGCEGRLEADVVAENVFIAGELKGNVTAKNLVEITEEGKVYGSITTSKLVTAQGVIFEGKCHMTSKDQALEPSLSLPAPLEPSYAQDPS